MRSLLAAFLVFVIAGPVLAAKTKPVSVTNFPAVQDVNVVGGCGSGGATVQLLGFTEAAVSPGVGIFTLTQACAAEFPSSLVCTSEQVIETSAIPTGLSGFAWVRPVFQPGSVSSAIDASGVSNGPEQFTCQGWSRTDILGLAVGATGSFELKPCSTALPVACCRLVPQ